MCPCDVLRTRVCRFSGSAALLLGVALCGAACAECKLHVYIFIPHGGRLGAKKKKYN